MEPKKKYKILKKIVVEACLKRMILKLSTQIMEQRQAIGRCIHEVIGRNMRNRSVRVTISMRELKHDSTVSLKRTKLAHLLKRHRTLSRQLVQHVNKGSDTMA